MPIFDQYEVEPASAYSGSYMDNAFFGDVLLGSGSTTNYILSRGYTQLGQINPITSRRNITSKITGEATAYPNIKKMWMPGYLFEGYASGSFLGRTQRFQNFFSNEYWYDSYMPNAIDIYLQNGGKIIGITYEDIFGTSAGYNETSGSNYSIYPLPELAAGGGEEPGITLLLSEKYSPLNGVQPDFDHIWTYSFPFQSRYKNILKIEQVSSRFPQLYNIDTYWPSTPVTPVSQSNRLAVVFNAGTGFNVYIGTMASPTLPYPPAITDASFKMGTVNPLTFYNFFFGIGNGGQLTKSGPGENQSWWTTYVYAAVYNWLAYVVPRGYKHGIRSVAPEQTKITYRIGRYGQVRDMLEGRPYTARLVPAGVDAYTGAPINRTLDFPLQVSYTSGTLIYSQSRDYVTATNPSYNPYDSGIYDIYYRSGQPFFDR